MSVIKRNVTVNVILGRKTKKIILNTSRKMSKFYMKLYDFFNGIANYFWHKAINDKKKK